MPATEGAIPGPPAGSEVPPPGPGARARTRRWIAVGLAIAIVVAVVLAGLYVAGVGPFMKNHGPTGPVTYRQAASAGASAVGSYDGGGWSLIAAASTDVGQAQSVPLLAVELALQQELGNCTVHWLTSASTFTVPAFTGNLDAGVSPFWELVYRNASVSGSGLLFVSVSNGSAQLTALLPASSACSADNALLSFVTPISSSAVDSPQAVAGDAAVGGGTFLSAHPWANVSLALTGGVSLFTLSRPSTWDVIFSTCPLVVTSPLLEPQFNATINAATGAVVFEQSVDVNCTTFSEPPTTVFASSLPTALTGSGGASAPSGAAYGTIATMGAVAAGTDVRDVTTPVGPSIAAAPRFAGDLRARPAPDAPLALDRLLPSTWTVGPAGGISARDGLGGPGSMTSLPARSLHGVGAGAWVGAAPVPFP